MQSLGSSGERVKLARSMLGLSRRVVEEQFNISSNTLQAWESNKIKLSERGAKKLNRIFANLGLLCSEDWLLTGHGQPPTHFHFQKIDSISSVIDDDICMLRELETFKAINPSPVSIVISDDGMEPLYSPGDFVAGNKKFGPDIRFLIGQNCIIETAQGDTLARKLLPGKSELFYSLGCINITTIQQPIIPNVKVRYAARIIFHRKRELEQNDK